MKIAIQSILIFCLFCTQGWAHTFRVNAFSAEKHHLPHAMVSLGWGHNLPVCDILNSPNGRVLVERFEVFDPSLKRVALRIPPHMTSEPDTSTSNIDVFDADLAMHKISLKEASEKGTYQVSAATKPTYYVIFKDKKGRKRIKMKPMDEVTGISEVLIAARYQAFAKAYFTNGPWNPPKALGHRLEIIPLTDLTQLKTGDLVAVKVLYDGQPLNHSPKSKEFITAKSNGFGQHEGFALFSKIKKGRAAFRVQRPGQWIIDVSHSDVIKPDGPLKEFAGKARQLYHAASLTFVVHQ